MGAFVQKHGKMLEHWWCGWWRKYNRKWRPRWVHLRSLVIIIIFDTDSGLKCPRLLAKPIIVGDSLLRHSYEFYNIFCHFSLFQADFKDNGGMYESFHCLMLLNGHYTSDIVELGVINVQLVSKTSLEGPVQVYFRGKL